MAAPKLSVLLPAYNAGATLAAALDSVARQTLTDWECVVVDDGSTDGSAEHVSARARQDPRFVLLRVPHGGIVAALEAGRHRCRAPVIARMDADDLAHRRRFALQLAALNADEALAAVGSHVRIFPRPPSPGLYRYERWLATIRGTDQVAREAFVECPVAHPTLMIRSDVLQRFGYRAKGWPEDYDLILRLLAAGERVGVVPRRLLFWRDTPARLSRSSADCGQDRIVACKAAFLASGFLAGRREYALWGYGDTGRELARALRGHDKHPSFIVEVHPGRLGQRILGVACVAPDAMRELRPERLVVSVAGAGPRAEIREALAGMGFVEQRDYVVAA
jgi:glycosyltransferase involved in cell wall biosynthesis